MVPPQGPATIVHGDYRLDNTIVSSAGDVQAVLDWEICTLGDPLADIGLLQVYWTGPDDAQSVWATSGTTAPGFWNRAQTAERYAEVSGRDVSHLDFYVAFGYWKLACVLEGVYSRYLGGALGDRDPAELAPFKAQVDGSARMAAETLERHDVSDDHHFVREPPELDEPVLVVMMSGWIDASGAAAAAMSTIEKETEALPLVTFDDDTYIDYRARRPMLELRDGVSTRLVWSAPELKVGHDANGRDVLLLTGPEPDMAWHRFAATVADLAQQLAVSKMAALGAYPFAAPHTRPPNLSATSPSAEVIAELPFRTSSVDVPAGMAAALEHALAGRGIPALGIWSQVPHYVASMSYPAASVALLEGLTLATGITVDGTELRREAVLQRERLDQLVEGNDEHRAMVAQFERMYDAAEQEADRSAGADQSGGGLELRSGDELAAEVERFLRDQGKG